MAKKHKHNKKKSTRAPAKANRSKGYKRQGKKKNPGVSLEMIRRAMHGKKKGAKHHKRNPSFLGMSGSEAVANSAAVLGAVTIAKLVPPMLPANWSATNMGRFFTTLGVAAAEVFAAHLLIPRYRTMVLAGAGAQTLSIALNPVLQKFSSSITLGRIQDARQRALGGGVADFVPGSFPEPHNPIWQRMAAAGLVTAGATGGSMGYRGRGRYH